MKRSLLTALLLLLTSALALVSCKKDNSSPSSLSGTVWKYNYKDVLVKGGDKQEGGGLKFLSATTVVYFDWEVEKNGEYVEEAVETGQYEYSAPEGVLIFPSGSYMFTVSGKTLKVSNFEGAAQVTMTRQ